MSGVTRAPRSGRLIPPWPVGRYRQLGGISSSSGALTLNRLMLHPFIAAEDFSIDKLGSVITTAQAAGLTRYGFYEAEEADWYPKDLIADLGTVLCDSNGYKAVDCDIDFEADRCYWLASVLQGQAGVVGSRMVCQDASLMPIGIPLQNSPPTSTGFQGFQILDVAGALPADVSGSLTPSNGAMIGGIARRSA
jgi:hypothetical protein